MDKATFLRKSIVVDCIYEHLLPLALCDEDFLLRDIRKYIISLTLVLLQRERILSLIFSFACRIHENKLVVKDSVELVSCKELVYEIIHGKTFDFYFNTRFVKVPQIFIHFTLGEPTKEDFTLMYSQKEPSLPPLEDTTIKKYFTTRDIRIDDYTHVKNNDNFYMFFLHIRKNYSQYPNLWLYFNGKPELIEELAFYTEIMRLKKDGKI